MPTSAEGRRAQRDGGTARVLLDTSAAVPALVTDHEHHRATLDAIGGRRAGLSGHAAFETYSVLTRLPGPARRPPRAVARLLAANFPDTRFLSPEGAGRLIEALAAVGASGGSVYDALVGAAATEHRLPLLTRDRRAATLYRALGAEVELLG